MCFINKCKAKEKSDWYIIQNFYVPRKKFVWMGLEQHEADLLFLGE